MPTLSVPAVAFIFALWLSGYVVLDLDRLSGPGHGHGSYFAHPAPAVARAALASAVTGSGSVSLAAASAGPVGTGGSVATSIGQPPDAGGGGGETKTTASSAQSLLLSPQVAAGCRIAMGVTMAFMLIIMI